MAMQRILSSLLVSTFLFLPCGMFRGLPIASAAQTPLEYEIGGPLEGPRLPLFPTQHGEAPGYPGCIPELAASSKTIDETSGKSLMEWTPQDQWPQKQLYPGSVENYRDYWLKYIPVRSMFDQGSLLHVWTAPNVPGLDAKNAEPYAAPLYWVPRHKDETPTGRFNKPVPVQRMQLGSPEIKLDCGKLPIGMYTVRIVGAVPTEFLTPLRKPLYLRFTVNDGNDGKTNSYRFRAGYTDEFYSIIEFYFHAPAQRNYSVSVKVDDGSTVPLLVQCVDLHDTLAGIVRRPIKTRQTLTTPQELELLRKQAAEKSTKSKDIPPSPSIVDANKRRDLDTLLWNSLPPFNAQIGGNYGEQRGYSAKVQLGWNGKTSKEIDAELGAWESPDRYNPISQTLLVNRKLNLAYTMADLAAGKPLPDPYPIKDTGVGVVTPANGDKPQQEFTLLADAVGARYNPYFHVLWNNANKYQQTADAEAGWSAAVQLCRIAWVYPALDASQVLGAVVSVPGGFGRDLHSRKRTGGSIGAGNGMGIEELLRCYDKIFPIIDGNQQLADSIGRFIPWVKSPKDVIELLDCYLVQYQAKQVIRYIFVFDNFPGWITLPASVLGDAEITKPYLQWLFAKAYVYPNPPINLPDNVISGNDRSGIGYIGSYSYGLGENALSVGKMLQDYIKSGGLTEFDLTSRPEYGQIAESVRFLLDSRIAGLHFPRIGDVGGPDKAYAMGFDSIVKDASNGWAWTKEPRFAYVIKHFVGRTNQTPAEWDVIEKAAATEPRAPWMESRSRLVANWFGVLEGGLEHDDYRFRSSAMLRMGLGYGHAHDDTLDLQITSMGLPMTIDAGQRVGYGKPGDLMTRLHNVVEIDGQEWKGHAWLRTMTDATDASYMRAEAVAPTNLKNVTLHQRQIALVQIDPGQGSRKLKPEEFKPGTKLDTNITPASSYVFDVVRVAGGKQHTYCFHAALEDELVTNISSQKPYEELSADLQEYVKIFRNQPIDKYPMQPQRYGGIAPDVLQATWRLAVEIPGNGLGEKEMNPDYVAGSPRKYTRLNLLGQQGASVLTGWYWCRQWSYGFNNLYTQKQTDATAMDSVFPAIIEPFAGQSKITGLRLMTIDQNETDAQRAVAVEAKLAHDRTDILFADARPQKTRAITSGPTVAGEFALVSRDAQGLRQVTLTGGSLLQTPEIIIQPVAAQRTGLVTQIDYVRHSMMIQSTDGSSWPSGDALSNRTIEIGVPHRMTAYTIKNIASENALNSSDSKPFSMTVTQGAYFYSSRITKIDPVKRIIETTTGMPMNDGAPVPGFEKELVFSNEEGTRFRHAQYLGRKGSEGGYVFEIDQPFSKEEFPVGSGVRLFEYGVGDQVRQSTFVNLRRSVDGQYQLESDVPFTLKIQAKTASISNDGKTWSDLKSRQEGPWLVLTLPAQDPSKTTTLRWTK